MFRPADGARNLAAQAERRAAISGTSARRIPAYYTKESGKWGEIIRSRGISLK